MGAAAAAVPAPLPARWVRRWGGMIGPALLFLALALVPPAARLGSEGYILSLMTRAVVLGLAAMSLNLLIGFGGLVSFGHAAFLGIGTYAVGILSAQGIDDGFAQLGCALAAAAAFALVTGVVALRTQGVYLIMITLAFAQMLYFVATALAQYGGDDGMTLASRSHLMGRDVLADDPTLYYACLGVLAGAYLLLSRLTGSRFGRVLVGARENAVRMRAIGFEPFRYQLVAYLVAGSVAAVAGCLLANQAGFVSPSTMAWQRSGDLIFMVVLGGLGSLPGSILGAVVFVVAQEILSGWMELWGLVFGPLLVLTVFVARDGLVGLLRGGARLAARGGAR